MSSDSHMFNLETSSHVDSIRKHSLCITNFILTKFYLLKQILIYKFTKNLNHLLLTSFYVTKETPHMQHMKHMNAIFETYGACMPWYLVIMLDDAHDQVLIVF